MTETQEAGGQQEPVVQETQESGNETQSKTIDPADHRRAIDDMLKFKAQARENAEQVAQFKAQIQEIQTNQMKEKEDYKSLWEETEAKANRYKEENDRLKENVFYNEKFRAVLPKLKDMGLKAGAEKYLEQHGLDSVEVETTSEGRFLVNGVDTFVEQFKHQNPFFFEDKRAPSVNHGGGQSGTPPGTETLTPAKLFEIEREGRASGDMSKYYKAVELYQKQRSGR